MPGVFTIIANLNLWTFEEFPNEIILQYTNTIFEKHLGEILFAKNIHK